MALLAGFTMMVPVVHAKSKAVAAPESTDNIQVVGHVSLTGGTVLRFFTTQHYNAHYLYAERDGGHGVALIDVTNAGKPSMLADIAYAPGGSDSIAVVAGTAALVTAEQADPPPPPPSTMRIMDFSDPRNPKVAREFTGVTAMDRDDRRGLIFLANKDGIWILKQHLADDPQVEKDYANYVLYSH